MQMIYFLNRLKVLRLDNVGISNFCITALEMKRMSQKYIDLIELFILLCYCEDVLAVHLTLIECCFITSLTKFKDFKRILDNKVCLLKPPLELLGQSNNTHGCTHARKMAFYG